MTLRSTVLGAALAVLVMTATTGAHHSTAMYDAQNPVTITGAVKRFEWTNPHAFVYLEVTDAQGKTHAQGLLAMEVELPDELVPPEEPG